MTTASELTAIRTAILEGAPGDEIGVPAPPRVVPGRGRPGRRAGDVRAGVASDDKDPRQSLHIDEVPLPELAPDEAYVAVMASSINFNTVWTSIFEPLPTFGFLNRLGKESVWGARHDQPYHVVGSDAAGVVLRVGSAVRNWRPGRHGDRALQPRRRPGPHRARRLDARVEPAHLGLRDQLRRPRRDRGREGQPAHAQAGPPHLGGGGGQRAHQLHELPHAGEPQRRADDPGPDGARSGARAAASAPTPCQYVLNGGGTPVAVVSSPEQAALLHELGVEHVIDRKAEGYRFWSDEHTQDPARVAPARARRSASSSASTPRSCSSTPVAPTMGASVFVCTRGGHDHHLRGHAAAS